MGKRSGGIGQVYSDSPTNNATILRLDENGHVVELIDGSAGALVKMEDLERIHYFEIDEVKV